MDSYRGWDPNLVPEYVGDAVFYAKSRKITDTKDDMLICNRTEGEVSQGVTAVITGELLSQVGIQRPDETDITWHDVQLSAGTMIEQDASPSFDVVTTDK